MEAAERKELVAAVIFFFVIVTAFGALFAGLQYLAKATAIFLLQWITYFR